MFNTRLAHEIAYLIVSNNSLYIDLFVRVFVVHLKHLRISNYF